MKPSHEETGATAPGRHARGNPGAPSLLIFTEHFNATYSISFELPLERLHARGDVNFSAYSQADVKAGGARCWKAWIRACRPKAVVLTRYGRPDGVEILEYCHRRGLPVVYHIDDDLLNMPGSLGEDVLKRHMAPEIVEARGAMLARCDVIYASTAALAEVLRRRFPVQQVFHGIYAPYLETRAGHADVELPITVGYMGSRGHQEDLALAVPAIVRLMHERPQLRFETFGTIMMPAELEAFGARVSHHPVQTCYADFLSALGRLDWHIGLAPLVDEPFNRCKAPTKFIEYTGSGIPVIASDIGVYASAVPQGGGALAGEDWYGKLATWLDDPAARLRSLDTARAYCRDAFALEKLAQQVMHVTTEVARRSPFQKNQGWGERGVAFWRHLGGRLARRLWGPERAGNAKAARTRILFVANSFLPTLQLCFTRPLQPLADADEIAWEVLADIQLHRAGQVLSGGRARWARRRIEAFQPNLVVFCRYSGAHASLVTDWARSRGVPTIFHLDDDLLNVPRELGAEKYAFHNQPARLAAVQHLLRSSDLVYCSTKPLLERMRPHGVDGRGRSAKIHCPGEVLRSAPRQGVFKIGYMGIDHTHDFEVALPALVRVLDRNPQVHFELFGPIAKPAVLDRFGSRVTQVEFVRSYDDFLRKFASLGWSIGICPLADTPFNRTKANNKWVEYTAVGAAVVATAGMLYDECCSDGCGLLAANDGQWEQALQSLIDDEGRRLAIVTAAQRRLACEYSPHALRAQLLELFRDARARRGLGVAREAAGALAA